MGACPHRALVIKDTTAAPSGVASFGQRTDESFWFQRCAFVIDTNVVWTIIAANFHCWKPSRFSRTRGVIIIIIIIIIIIVSSCADIPW
jgi:hypothetical protein